MVYHAKQQHNIEMPHLPRRQLIDIRNAVVHTGAQLFSRVVEVRVVPAVHGNNFGTTTLHLKAEPAIPGTDVEHPFAAQVLRNWKPGQVAFEFCQAAHTLDPFATGKYKTVPPALLGQLPTPVAEPPVVHLRPLLLPDPHFPQYGRSVTGADTPVRPGFTCSGRAESPARPQEAAPLSFFSRANWVGIEYEGNRLTEFEGIQAAKRALDRLL
jgi:hypothetical protein